jgi:hypothetical protein
VTSGTRRAAAGEKNDEFPENTRLVGERGAGVHQTGAHEIRNAQRFRISPDLIAQPARHCRGEYVPTARSRIPCNNQRARRSRRPNGLAHRIRS